MATVNQILETLAALHMGAPTTPAAQAAYPYPPMTVPQANLPAWVFWLEASEVQAQAYDLLRVEWQVTALFLLRPVETERLPQDLFNALAANVTPVLTWAPSYMELGGLIRGEAVITRARPDIIELGGTRYAGITYNWRVVDKLLTSPAP